jgi:hypothetical protein
MEEQDHSEKSDYSKNNSPTDNPLAHEIPDPAPNPSRSSGEPERKAPSRTQRLSEAFWEGVSSARPGYNKQSAIRNISPAPGAQQTSDLSGSGSLDWVIQRGKSAAAVVGNTTSSVADSVAKLAKKAPAIPAKWGEAFREGAASVRSGAVKPKTEPIPPPAGRQTAVGKEIWDSVSQIGDSAADFVRSALATVKPGEAGVIEKKIRLSEKKIKDLYLAIGREAAESFSKGGPVETEKVGTLMEEFRKEEEVIQILKASLSEITPAKKAGAPEVPPLTPVIQSKAEDIQEEFRTEAEVAAAPGVQEDILPAADISTPTPDEPLEIVDRPVRSTAEMILSATSEAELLSVLFRPESSASAEPAAQEEAGVEAESNLSAGPEVGQEKIEEVSEMKETGEKNN